MIQFITTIHFNYESLGNDSLHHKVSSLLPNYSFQLDNLDNLCDSGNSIRTVVKYYYYSFGQKKRIIMLVKDKPV